MRWTQAVPKTRALSCGRRSRVVLTPRRWCQVGGSNSAGDGGQRARAPAIECTHLLLLRSAKTDSLAGGELAEGGLMTVAFGLGLFGACLLVGSLGGEVGNRKKGKVAPRRSRPTGDRGSQRWLSVAARASKALSAAR